MIASFNGHVDVARVLIEANARVNRQSKVIKVAYEVF